ncbi:U-box domain-containing protein 30 [Striga hermonthica]|uniref:U-box domain-containing protein n=1 Tax=Striga hermonthica TaxID=68872 RepID=A0A9N7N7X0_STRHE|nr:U-box domain-containing protein 30 [Striga hermonthica]
MPMFQPQPAKKDGFLGIEVLGDGLVLDLDTEAKNGVLDEFGQKLSLKKMIEELNLPEVPSVFICPISLEPMQEPVTLCTGQTYEKSNILKWFSLGHFTCPTTMQELWDYTLTPNTTLNHLILTWFSQKYIQVKKRSQDAQGRAIELLNALKKVKGQSRIQTLKELKRVVANHTTSRKTVVDEGGVTVLLSLLGPFTSYAVGSELIGILVNLSLSPESKTNLMQPAKISTVVDILNEGSFETKVNCVRLIKTLMEEEKAFRKDFVSSHRLLLALMRLVRDKRSPDGLFPGLGLLKLISMHEHVRGLIVSIGAVPQLVELIPFLNNNNCNNNAECIEMVLFVLDVLCSVSEGRQALKDCPNTIPNLVNLLVRISEKCTEYTLSILWSVCRLCPEECSSRAVEAGLAAKLLLVIQSGCKPALKQRASELLKLCSLNYSDTIFISKCKLTRTIQ